MQAGLMNTYRHPASNRSWVAWGLSLLLFAGYVLLYFGGNRSAASPPTPCRTGRAAWASTASGRSMGSSTRWP